MMIPKIADLKKETLVETYKNINRLLKEESGENYNNFQELIKTEEQLNEYEQSVRLMIIDSLRSKEGVIQALLSGDVIQIKRALNCKWFFKDAVPPSFYETKIFPVVSFSTRCKIINRLSKHLKDPEHAEQLFGFVRKNYGSRYAEILLPRCRPDFITSYITEYKPAFQHNTSVRILVEITQKNPEIVMPLMESMCQEDYPYQYRLEKFSSVFLCLAKNHPKLFTPFYEKHYLSLLFLRLGNKLTRNFNVLLHKVILESDGQLHRGLISEQSLFDSLDFNGKIDFLASIVKSKKKNLCNDNWFWALPNILLFIKSKPASERVKILEAVFKQVYEKDLWDHPKLWRIQVLELLPLDVRERCVNILSSDDKYASIELHGYPGDNDKERSTAEKFLYLLRCEESIPKLQEIIKKTPCAEKRKTLVIEMAKSCAINKDLKNLQKLCEYITAHHRNDDCNLIKSFLQTIQSVFNCKKFDLNIWSILEEIATMSVLSASAGFDVYKPIMENFIFFRFKNNLDPTEQVKNVVKFAVVNYPYVQVLFRDMRDANSEKYFHLYYEELFKTIEQGNLKYEKVNTLCFSVVDTLNEYNKRHKKNPIQVEDLTALLSHLDRITKDNKWEYNYHLVLANPYLKEKYATDILQENFIAYLLQYLLKAKPGYFKSNLSNILNNLFTEYNRNFKEFLKNHKKIFDFLNLTEEIKKITKEEFLSADSFTRKLNALKLYSYFAGISEFQELVKAYEPKEHRIDYKNKESEFVKIQITVPELIKNIKPDSKNYEFIFKFMHGDFLKPVLSSFNSACFNSPVGLVISLLKEKLNAPVSVKKCILRNISEVSSTHDKLEFCIGLWEKEKHYSIRTVIFSTISKCFLEEPTEDLFSAVKKCILESDEQTFEARPGIGSVPARFLNEYATDVWLISEKVSSSVVSLNSIRNSLIESFTPKNIWNLSDDFCEKIITTGIFLDESKLRLGNFACYYLISNPHSMSSKLNTLLNLMYERKQNRNSIVSFLDSLQAVSLQHPRQFHDIFDGIINFWDKVLSRIEFFEEHLRLQLYRAYHKVLPSENSKDKLKLSVDFAEELKKVIKATPNFKEFYSIFVDVVKSFIENAAGAKCPLDSLLVIRQLITPPERELAIIGILLLPDGYFKANQISEAGDVPVTLDRIKNVGYIIKTVKNFQDEVVQIYFHNSLSLINKDSKKRPFSTSNQDIQDAVQPRKRLVLCSFAEKNHIY